MIAKTTTLGSVVFPGWSGAIASPLLTPLGPREVRERMPEGGGDLG